MGQIKIADLGRVPIEHIISVSEKYSKKEGLAEFIWLHILRLKESFWIEIGINTSSLLPKGEYLVHEIIQYLDYEFPFYLSSHVKSFFNTLQDSPELYALLKDMKRNYSQIKQMLGTNPSPHLRTDLVGWKEILKKPCWRCMYWTEIQENYTCALNKNFYIPYKGCMRTDVEWESLKGQLIQKNKTEYLVVSMIQKSKDIYPLEECPGLDESGDYRIFLEANPRVEPSKKAGELLL